MEIDRSPRNKEKKACTHLAASCGAHDQLTVTTPVVNLDYSLDLPRSNHLKLLDLHFERRKRRALDNSSAKQKLQDSICKTCQLRFISAIVVPLSAVEPQGG